MKRLGFSLVFFAVLAVPQWAAAFCGFYVAGGDTKLFNDASQVVLMRHNKTTVLSMQNNYEGPTADFAMIVPVPQVLQKENVKTLDKAVFDRVDRLSAPRLVEYWERDPCAGPDPYAFDGFGSIGIGRIGISGRGMGGGGTGYVKVEAEFEVGEYDIVMLSTNDSTALDDWLKANNYSIPAGAEPFFRPYVARGDYFFVARVDADRVKMENGKAVLSPLRFHYESNEFSLPIRLGMINSKGKQDLIVYILADDQRYEVANYPNATIPTNIEVGTAVRENFGEFYEALFARTVEENPRAIVTEYSWAATKCDPCPTGMLGGAGLGEPDLATLGNDVLKLSFGWNSPGWTLTRLHARYAPDDIGEDLVFRKADPIAGGREVYVDSDNRELEKEARPSAQGNNFQGRYVMRHEWEGEVACAEPKRGQWGPPADAHGMTLVADTVAREMRRQAAAALGREPSEEELAAPRTAAESEAIAFHLRKRFGTSVAPKEEGSGPATAPSVNTRGGQLGAAVELAHLVREPIPTLKVVPQEPPAPVAPVAPPAPVDAPATVAPPAAAAEPTGCATADARGATAPALGLIALVWGTRRRRRR